MSIPNPCPDPVQLRELLDRALSEQDQCVIQSHLDTCESCQRILEALVAGKDSWSGAIRQLAETSMAREAALDAVIMQAKRAPEIEPSQFEGMSSGPVLLDFLQPSEQSGIIGRLGHYDVIEMVGRGGMGVVLKAFDSSLRRIVAIKVMSQHLAANAPARRRFVREAHSAAAVAHDHVVAIHAVDDRHEPPYLVMQFIEGKTLQDRLDQSGPMDVREILRIGMQTAAGLAAAHAQGLVHRDIKPANILLENGVERVKLTDFGLARAVDDASMTHSGMIAGTPQFMSPEQARGEMVDHRSDLFSLGSVLYAMCVGHAPFRATTTMGVLKRVCEEQPHPIREVNADIPEWLISIVSKLLAKNPADRFQSAKEVAELLGQYLAHVQHPFVAPLPAAPIFKTSSATMSPFGAPVSELKPAFGPWRDGSLLVMHRRSRLPDRCVKTNQPTAFKLDRHLYWHHPILYLLFFVNPLIFIVVARLLKKTSDIQVGLSHECIVRRRWVIGLGWLGFLAGVGLAGIGLTRFEPALLITGLGVAVAAGVISAKIAEIVAVSRIDGEYIFLRGICSDFLDTLPAWSNRELSDSAISSIKKEPQPSVPTVHPMYVALFWSGFAILAVLIVVAVLVRLQMLPASFASGFSSPMVMLIAIGHVALVLMLILQAIVNRDWRATALGQRPLPAAITLGAMSVVAVLLLVTWDSDESLRSFLGQRAKQNKSLVILSTNPNPAVMKELRQLIAQREQDLKDVRVRFEAGTVSGLEALRAERYLLEAKIRLAMTESKIAEAVSLYDELVRVHEQSVAIAEEHFSAGVMPQSEVSVIRNELIEARIQRETVRQQSVAPTTFAP